MIRGHNRAANFAADPGSGIGGEGAVLPPGANAVVEATSGALAQGLYFAKKQFQPKPLPRYETTRDKLPAHTYDENPDWVRVYCKAWELEFRNIHESAPVLTLDGLNHPILE